MYISGCPKISLPPPRDRYSFVNEAGEVLEKLKSSIANYEVTGNKELGIAIVNTIAYMTHDYPAKAQEYEISQGLKVSKTSRRRDDTSVIIKNAKRYFAVVTHTEVMYYILKKSNKLSAEDGKVIVSGKCPCPDCDVFLTSTEVRPVFSNAKMIGYAYGWMAQDPIKEKEAYRLSCRQLVSPKDVTLSDILNPHVPHIGNTPLVLESVIQGDLQTFVIGPTYNDPLIVSTECSSADAPAGKCIICNLDKSKQSGYQNAQLTFDTLQ